MMNAWLIIIIIIIIMTATINKEHWILIAVFAV